MTTASHFFSFSRINTKCTLCVHTGAKRSTLGAFDIRGTCWTSEISSGAVVVENAPSSPIWWSQRRAPTVPRGGGDERPRALDRLSPSSYPFARARGGDPHRGAPPTYPPPPQPPDLTSPAFASFVTLLRHDFVHWHLRHRPRRHSERGRRHGADGHGVRRAVRRGVRGVRRGRVRDSRVRRDPRGVPHLPRASLRRGRPRHLRPLRRRR